MKYYRHDPLVPWESSGILAITDSDLAVLNCNHAGAIIGIDVIELSIPKLESTNRVLNFFSFHALLNEISEREYKRTIVECRLQS